MTSEFLSALSAGTERLAAWSDLLDSINVFPVADGDTGRNLVLSLAPLRVLPSDSIINDLLLSARGNSGNIAASFFTGFLSSNPHQDMAHAVSVGRKRAFGAVPDPRKGTMLDIFDTLEELAKTPEKITNKKNILENLKDAVMATTEINPELKKAMVVDSGALGMFIFFDAFFNALNGTRDEMNHIAELFNDRLTISADWKKEEGISGSCIDFVMKIDGDNQPLSDEIGRFDDSVVAIRQDGYIKIHLHANSSEELRSSVSKLGKVVKWSEDDLMEQTKNFGVSLKPALHIVTDAAGSVTRNDAAELGFSLLDSYISLGRLDMPETCLEPSVLYSAMRKGIRATTAQASVFERYQHYEKVLGLYGRALYLCVGSAFTGNYQVATDWKAAHDPDNRLTIIDTGAASGRLGLMVLAVARYSLEAASPEDVIEFAGRAVALCEEYVFIDKLQYLVAGGRVSKTSGFFADMLNMKPVVSPQPEGVKKLGVVRNRKDQVAFALKRLRELLKDRDAIIMLEYSDNQKLLETEIKPLLHKEFKGSEIILQPLSLTSGTHMGPGTWAVAVMPYTDGLKIRREG
jgi:DegV family protein with EDD domain